MLKWVHYHLEVHPKLSDTWHVQPFPSIHTNAKIVNHLITHIHIHLHFCVPFRHVNCYALRLQATLHALYLKSVVAVIEHVHKQFPGLRNLKPLHVLHQNILRLVFQPVNNASLKTNWYAGCTSCVMLCMLVSYNYKLYIICKPIWIQSWLEVAVTVLNKKAKLVCM